MSKKLEEALFNLKFASKQYEKEARRFEKRARAEKAKIKRALERGEVDSAEVYTENTIRFKNQALRYLQLSARVENAYNTVNSSVNIQMVSKSMKGIVRALEETGNANEMDKMVDVMNRFESECEKANIRTDHMESAIDSASSRTMKKEQVRELMQQVMDEHGLDVTAQMDSAGIGKSKAAANTEKVTNNLEERLKRLQEL